MLIKEILANPDSSVPYCHCPSIVLTPSGDLLVAWYAYPSQETRNGTLVLARRRAGEKRFERPRRILSQMNSSLGNPVLFCDENGQVHLMFVVLRGHYWDSAVVNVCHSDDMGQTWSTPNSARQNPGMMIRHPPIARRNAYLLLPAYDEKKNQTVILTADPEATAWLAVEHFDGLEAIQGCIVREGDAELTMLLRPCGEARTCLRSLSGDDGRTWSPVLRTTLPNPLSGLAGFQVDGALCAVYNHTTEHRRYPLSLSYSKNRGTSWIGPIHIDETPQEVSYPAFVVDSSGVAHGVYSVDRRRIRYVAFDQTWWMQ